MHYIKDIFEKKVTPHSHDKFVRYSKGDFIGPLLKIKVSKTEVKLSTSFHFIDELLILLSEVLNDNMVHVKGSLIWNQDLSPDMAKLGIKYSKVTKSRGIFKYQLENDVPFKQFVETMNNYNVLVSLKTDEVSLTTKSSFPKPNKEFTADFCKAVFPLKMLDRILEEFAFDVKDKKKVKDVNISHRIKVEDIILPSDAPDFETARREAKRVGKLDRVISVNGGEEVHSTINFNI